MCVCVCGGWRWRGYWQIRWNTKSINLLIIRKTRVAQCHNVLDTGPVKRTTDLRTSRTKGWLCFGARARVGLPGCRVRWRCRFLCRCSDVEGYHLSRRRQAKHDAVCRHRLRLRRRRHSRGWREFRHVNTACRTYVEAGYDRESQKSVRGERESAAHTRNFD